ncbi:MAG: PQQ-binding-like beta-propeller repeat protein [Planctomycetota bacterium]
MKNSKKFVLCIAVLAILAVGCDSQQPVIEETGAGSRRQNNNSKTESANEYLDSGQFQIPSGNDAELENSYSTPLWGQYRGNSTNSIHNRSLLTSWSDSENILFKTELPGRGASSPIVGPGSFGIVATSYSGFAESAEAPGKKSDLVHYVTCLSSFTGHHRWIRKIKAPPIVQNSNENLIKHGFASSTPATDGNYIFAYFGASGLFAFDWKGKLVWKADLGYWEDYFGSSASPLFYDGGTVSEFDDDLLIVNASIESQSIYAIRPSTGKGIWRIRGIKKSWSMPVIGKNPAGEDELVIMEQGFVRGYDPKTGIEKWHCQGVNNYVVATPFIDNGVCYCNGGIQKQLMAIKMGGEGDVTETHKLWEVPMGANVSSPLYLTGVIYLVSDNGILQCFNATDGKLLKKHRLPTKTRFYSNPLLAGNALYIPLEDNGIYVCEANLEAKKISHNQLSDKASQKASLAVYDRKILIRNDNYLTCVGYKPEKRLTNRLAGYEADGDDETIKPFIRYDYADALTYLKQFAYLLDPNELTCKKIIIAPYRSVITDEQKEKSFQLVDAQIEKFRELRNQLQDAYWELLKSGSQDTEAFDAEIKRIEKETEAHANQIRIEVKKLFSKEQMDQHLKEAAERKAAREKAAQKK